MTLHLVVFLLGLLAVPLVLLGLGHRFRRRAPWQRRMFWGAILGYGLAVCLSLISGIVPPESWGSHDHLRGFAGYWSLVVFPLIGGAWGAFRTLHLRSE